MVSPLLQRPLRTEAQVLAERAHLAERRAASLMHDGALPPPPVQARDVARIRSWFRDANRKRHGWARRTDGDYSHVVWRIAIEMRASWRAYRQAQRLGRVVSAVKPGWSLVEPNFAVLGRKYVACDTFYGSDLDGRSAFRTFANGWRIQIYVGAAETRAGYEWCSQPSWYVQRHDGTRWTDIAKGYATNIQNAAIDAEAAMHTAVRKARAVAPVVLTGMAAE